MNNEWHFRWMYVGEEGIRSTGIMANTMENALTKFWSNVVVESAHRVVWLEVEMQ